MNSLLKDMESNNPDKRDKAIRHGLTQLLDNELRNELSGVINQQSNRNKFVLLRRGWIGIAASVIVLIGFFTLVTPTGPKSLAETYFSTEEFFHPGATKGISTEPDQADIYTAFNAERYAEVVSLYSNLPNIKIEDRYYLAISLMKTGSFQQAIGHFEQIITANGPFLDESKWYSALALIILDKSEESVSLLEEIRVGSWKAQEARKLLRRL